MKFKKYRGRLAVQSVLAAVNRVENTAHQHCAAAWKTNKPWSCDCIACAAVRIPGAVCNCSVDAEIGHERYCAVVQGLRHMVMRLERLLNEHA